MAIPGITILGATSMLSSDGDISVESSPVYIAASVIETQIADGSWTAGHLNNVEVFPPVTEWPVEWQFLKEN